MSTPQNPFEPSLSVDVECTLTADFFTQMRSAMNLQRMLVNQMTLDSPNMVPGQNLPNPLDWGLPQSANTVSGNSHTGRRYPRVFRPRSQRATCCGTPPLTARRR